VDNLQSTDECGCGYVFIVVVPQRHLALEIVDVALQALPWFHSDREDIVIPLELSPRSELIIEAFNYIIEILKGVLRE